MTASGQSTDHVHRPDPTGGDPAERRPKLVATDLDGTLLRSDGTVSARTREALARVERLGSTLVLATGRPVRWLAPVVEQIGHRGLAVCSNGAVVYDLATERVVEQHPVAPEVGRSVIEGLAAAIDGVSFAVERDDGLVHDERYPVPVEAARAVVGDLEELLRAPSVKVLVRHESYDADTLLDRAREVVGDLAELTHSNGRGLVEISAPGVSKASTLATLCRRWDVDSADVVAFGDMPNDLPMLAWAGRPYAVANAHPQVLATVARRCPPNDEDGVAQVLEELFA